MPVRFATINEYEIAADRTQGFDENDDSCFCAYRYVLSELRSDDDDLFYEMSVYAERLTGWRLRDGRWLALRRVIGNCEAGIAHSFFSFSETMPR